MTNDEIAKARARAEATANPQSKLGAAIAKGATPASSRFQTALASARPIKRITIPGLGLEANLTLIGTERALDMEGVVNRRMEARGLEANVLTQGMFELERARHILAECVLEDDGTPMGSLEDWGQVPKETIAALWGEYADLAEENEPISAPLTDEERRELGLAIVKKNRVLLRCFGARRLADYLLTTDFQPASSAMTESSPGESSSGSSD